jgi:capsid protein
MANTLVQTRRRILGPDGQPWAPRRGIEARYESAASTKDNYKRWSWVDSLSPDALATSEVRKILRNRCRYEVRNNSYLSGMLLSLANDCIGVGPQLQMQTGNDALDTMIETSFWQWSREVRLAEKLRLMRVARAEAGEAFGILVSNPNLLHPVKMSLSVREAEEIADPALLGVLQSDWYDGIRFDEYGNPVSYRVLRAHPGATGVLASLQLRYDDIKARYVLHYYRPARPGQRRGIPDVTPAIGIFMELRRTCEAVIAAYESAADFAAVLETDQSPDADEAIDSAGTTTGTTVTPQALDLVELTRRAATVLPRNYKLSQVKAEHPSANYEMFVNQKLREAARCLNMPFTIAALDSSQANMSAAYLDHQTYAKAILVDRDDMEVLLDRLLDQWMTEAVNTPDALPAMPDRVSHSWRWPLIGNHADPMKVAVAQSQRLANHTTSLAAECGRNGDDWEEVLRQRAKEKARMRELGLIEEQPSEESRRAAMEDDEQPPAGRGAPGRPRNR